MATDGSEMFRLDNLESEVVQGRYCILARVCRSSLALTF